MAARSSWTVKLNADAYKRVVAVLAKKKAGMTRYELLESAGLGATGKMTEILETLESGGFIRSYRSFGAKKKNSLYQLTDPFTLFHFRFLETPSTGNMTVCSDVKPQHSQVLRRRGKPYTRPWLQQTDC